MKLLIKNGRIVDPSQNLDKVMDLLLADGKVAKLAEHITDVADETYDASGKVVAPGFIDMHTHMREPGLEAKESIRTGTMAAAAGGITTIACMPNTKPAVSNSIVVTGIKARAAEEGYANVEVIGSITKDQKGTELAEMGDMLEKGAVAFSDDGHYVDSSRLLLNAARYISNFDAPLISHSIESELNADGYMHEGAVSAKIGVPGVPSVAEDIAVARDTLIAGYTGAHIHIAHVASKGAVDIIREAKAKGYPVTAEVTVHHLTLTDEACAGYSTATRVSPPLRSRDHVEGMRAGLKDGTIDIIVTDHAPHAPEEKDVEFRKAPNGFCGLETSVGVILTELYHTGFLTINEIVDKMSCKPAEIFRLKGGKLTVGAPADVTILDLEQEWTVDNTKFYTTGKVSPFNGKKCKGKAVAAVLAGKLVMRDGVVLER
ncbi:MAG: dihydroorotase [Succiniclasticum sp.]|nr:dihydroorotase [Succiniclasticum sp.]